MLKTNLQFKEWALFEEICNSYLDARAIGLTQKLSETHFLTYLMH